MIGKRKDKSEITNLELFIILITILSTTGYLLILAWILYI